MKFYSKISSMLVAAAFLSILPVEAQTFRQTKQGITGTTQGMDIEIQFISPEIVRVVKAPEGRSFTKKSLSVVKSPESMSVTAEKKGETVSLKSNAVRVDFNVETGRISFFDKQGKALFTEKDYGAQFTPFNDAGNQTFSVRQAFLLDKDEAIYGLGQQQVDDLNQRNHKHFMRQRALHASVPIIQSTKGYGMFWDNYSPTTYTDNPQEMSFDSEVGECMDYYFMYGGNADGVIAQIRDLTGQAPMYPLWTFGFWQSRERYKSQQETMEVVDKYRELGIPLDGIVTEGESMLDTRALTGESVPRSIRKGEEALSGCVNQSGVLTIKVTKSFGESTVTKIIDLVENASSRKAPTENFITTFARYYTPVVVILAAFLAILPPIILGGGWTEWIRRGFVFLVVSCPCALVISIPLTFFGGIGAASKRGVLVKGSNYLEALNNVSVIVFDKTGTLTKGVFNVTDILPANGFSKEQVLEYAAEAESFSNHPIAKSILAAYGKEIDQSVISDYKEISGYGISVMAGEKKVFAGNTKLMDTECIEYTTCEKAGTKVYLAVDGQYAGCILITDEVKPDSKKAISDLKHIGVEKTVMLTGDDEKIGKSVAEELQLDEYYAQLLPDQKVEKVELLDSKKRPGSKLAFVGDGINDAPVLARADVGIAMGGLGSDAAIEAADVVLMTDEPSKLVDAIEVAKATKQIVMQNIVIALGIKSVFLILGALGIAGMWEAVFGDVGVTIIAVLNAMRILKK